MNRVAANSNLYGWLPVVTREQYFESEVAAFQATLDDIRDLPQTTDHEEHQ